MTPEPHTHTRRRGRREGSARRLRWVFGLTLLFMFVEVLGGWLSGSLALLADAGHMFTDAGALGLALVAFRLAGRPPTPDRTYGLVRVEILAALVNGAALLLIAGLILVEAWERIQDPREIEGTMMMTVATVGLVVNLVGAWLLHGHAHDNLNVRGAYLHVLADLLGSIGTLIAAGIVVGTGWTMADPIVSVLLSLLILGSAWKLVQEATRILLEAAPPGIDVSELVEDLGGIEGLDEVHDVHVWSLTSGFVALTGHGVVDLDDLARQNAILDEVRARAAGHGVGHVTFQIEPRERHDPRDRSGPRGAA